MRRSRLCLLLVAAAATTVSVLAGCSRDQSGPLAAPGFPRPCRVLAQLAKTAERVERADLADPTRFQRALDASVEEYVEIVAELRSVVPARLRPDLDRLRAAVEQYRFQDAIDARAALDDYESSTCPSEATPTTTTAG